MTKKDYILIAAALYAAGRLYDNTDIKQRSAIDTAVLEVGNALQTDNPRFDRVRFNIAAGLSGTNKRGS